MNDAQKMTHAITRYRDKHGLTIEAFGEKIGAGKGMVWKWENFKAEPSRKNREKIIKATDGEITAADLLLEIPA